MRPLASLISSALRFRFALMRLGNAALSLLARATYYTQSAARSISMRPQRLPFCLGLRDLQGQHCATNRAH